jgi:hypothetical protein
MPEGAPGLLNGTKLSFATGAVAICYWLTKTYPDFFDQALHGIGEVVRNSTQFDTEEFWEKVETRSAAALEKSEAYLYPAPEVTSEPLVLERPTIPRDTPAPVEPVDHPKPKVDYDLAERNLSGVAERYKTSVTSDELVRGMQDGALRHMDEPVTLTQEEALAALQKGTFTKDGVRWEVWESKTYPGTFYITKLPV